MQEYNTIVRCGNHADLSRLAKCDFSFEITSELAEPFEGMRTNSVGQPYRKNYDYNANELAESLNRSDAELFVAQINDSPVGYLAVSQDWNNYALIEDFAVDAFYRGSGVGRLMMGSAKKWSRERGLAGLRLETQSINVAACRFYERYGFLLGGHDRYLYRGLHSSSQEVALFWYLHF